MARPPRPVQPVPDRPDPIAWVGPVLLAFGVRLFLAARTSGLTMDSALYVRMAEALRAGTHEPSPAHHGYPILVALASVLLPGREWPARIVSWLASLALVVLVQQAARRRMGARAGWVAGLAVALHPLLAIYGVAVMTEAAFLALAFAGMMRLDRGAPRSGGALLGAAWWVRPEAAVLAPLAVMLAPLSRRARVVALAAALVVALPYTLVLRVEQGYWSLTPKTALVHAPAGELGAVAAEQTREPVGIPVAVRDPAVDEPHLARKTRTGELFAIRSGKERDDRLPQRR